MAWLNECCSQLYARDEHLAKARETGKFSFAGGKDWRRVNK